MLRQRLALGVAALALTTAYGCGGKEKTVDVETPIGDVEVLEDKSTGEVEVNVDAGQE